MQDSFVETLEKCLYRDCKSCRIDIIGPSPRTTTARAPPAEDMDLRRAVMSRELGRVDELIRRRETHNIKYLNIARCRNMAFRSACRAATEARDYIELSQLIDMGADAHKLYMFGDDNPLYVAIMSHDFNGVRWLIKAGIEINAYMGAGKPGYHISAAIRTDQPETVKLLIGAGASVDGPGPRCHSPIRAAIRAHNLNIVMILVEAGADINDGALDDAVGADDLNIVKFLVGAGAGIDGRPGDAVPLRVAIGGHNLNYDIVKFLVESGAEVNTTDNQRVTILHAAIDAEHLDTIRLLVGAGADVNATGCGYPPEWTLSPLRFAQRPARYNFRTGAADHGPTQIRRSIANILVAAGAKE